MIDYVTIFLAISALSAITLILNKSLPQGRKRRFCRGRAWIEIDRQSLYQNVQSLTAMLPPGCRLMPAVKADAYGHGAVIIAKALNDFGISHFCVATVAEGIELRQGGIKGDILVLGYTHPEQLHLLIRYRLIQTVVDYPYAQILNGFGRRIRVHIKIDTGMHRLGERYDRIDEIAGIFDCRNLSVEGLYSHLCTADAIPEQGACTQSGIDYVYFQAKALHDVTDQLEKRGIPCPAVHLTESYGLIHYPELSGDYARIGIALYGVLSSRFDRVSCPARLAPVLSVKARVAAVKELSEGEAAGYGLQYKASQNTRIAVLTIGYADGIPRALSCGVGKVLINGREAPIIGRICMDQTLVEVSGIEVSSGDIAVVIGSSGNKEITAYDIAEQAGTITNELLSRLGARLERIMG